MDKKKVLLGMSGGVDSSVAAILLKEQGYDVFGVTMELWENEDEKLKSNCSKTFAVQDAKKVCDFLDIPHFVIDLKNEFKEHVITDFIATYKECKTPNPCIECNKYLKFGAMYKKAQELGIEYIATGHYAKTKFSEKYNRYVIEKSNSKTKDQTYVLYNIPKEIIGKVIFPLGDFENKEQIREIARKNNLEVASKPDSEDICFIPDNDYISFLEKNSDIKSNEGNIVNKKGIVLGKHKGLHRYTIGQRRGISIAAPDKLYVIKLNKKNNELVVGSKEELYSNIVYVEDINLILIDEIKESMEVKAKIRYAAKEEKATIYPIENGIMKVVFKEPQRAITPGQAIVFYIDDYVLGGGKII